EPVDHSVSLLRLAAWQSARAGLARELLHPLTMRRLPAESVVRALLDHVGDALAGSGDLHRAREAVDLLLRRGNGARVQRELMERTGSLRDVVAECVRHTQG
ncbi:carboxylate--amine ligase, partial [Streptomyces carpinensis]